MIATQDHLGIGIYTPPQAAFYARVSPRMMTRWVFGDSAGKPVIQRQDHESSEKTVTFLDFVQTLAVREVRHRHKLPLQRIRQGVDQARLRYSIDYPLAQEHCIYLFSDQKGKGHGHIVIRLKGDDKEVEDHHSYLRRPLHEIREEVRAHAGIAKAFRGRAEPRLQYSQQPERLDDGLRAQVLLNHRRERRLRQRALRHRRAHAAAG